MLTFVTVVFEPEVALLRRQARTLARHAEPELVTQIIVIDNSAFGLPERAWRRVLAAYGPLAGVVRRVRAAEVISGPVPPSSGWVRQQILKLEVAGLVSTPWYVVLDAKNLAAAPLRWETFIEPDGRAKMGRHSYASHPLRESVARTIAAVGGDPAWIEDFPVTHTPVTLRTEAVCGLVDTMAEPGERSFADRFVAEGLLEFPLYSATVLRDGEWERWHSRGVVQSPTLWRRDANRAGVARFAERVRTDHAAFVAVHRAAVVRLGPVATARLAALLVERGVCSGPGDAWGFLLGAKLNAGAAVLRARWRRLRRGGRA